VRQVGIQGLNEAGFKAFLKDVYLQCRTCGSHRDVAGRSFSVRCDAEQVKARRSFDKA